MYAVNDGDRSKILNKLKFFTSSILVVEWHCQNLWPRVHGNPKLNFNRGCCYNCWFWCTKKVFPQFAFFFFSDSSFFFHLSSQSFNHQQKVTVRVLAMFFVLSSANERLRKDGYHKGYSAFTISSESILFEVKELQSCSKNTLLQ